jgi:hypothetical protein
MDKESESINKKEPIDHIRLALFRTSLFYIKGYCSSLLGKSEGN